ncbi:MAG: DUF3307 domain-containing protein [Thermotogaceae bacterium]|nr:DUF3307 domain-containing protein [Thermotogaceae bacterium]
MIESFVHLYLGHLFGDYVLQFGWIAANKAKSKTVLISHVLLVYLSQITFSLGYGYRFFHFILIAAVGITHYFLDSLKLSKGSNGWQWYLLDQFFHLITVLVITPFFTDVHFFVPEDIAEKLMITIFNAYFLSFLGYFIFRKDEPYNRDWPGYIIRGAFPWTGNIFYVAVLFGIEILRNFLKRNERGIIIENTFVAGLAFLTTILWEVLVC